ncbi:NmrA/HSCARG family protein [Rhizobium laguerreae]|uniref:NmrA/HSCARG family protein n=1 Tax=Rhizobium laguerreae TaxID=1076926 RepID=UPI00143F4D3B|nr:NmrA/HSCARG family protein [Rhizobium laguerreae]MBN9984228.1 NmrA/HSCARG family protein [Rhizobium laguerreae]MBY3103540.1 NmrA/HSCARG family protein [Rhizobium laguerreae]MBY3248774.1 NmrA/HSCARG family protein [Rhizobium laguerreae]MBY3315593.1 NmrA/HSCARG family protein [Rhizobium laguerreae]MBY3357605.1 NmrA/HSCARG family protein [Rhizobium laguerreae]
MSADEKPLIAIAGATSKQGRSVAAALLQSQRFRVRAFTRKKDAPEALRLEELGAEIVTVPLQLGLQKDLVAAFKGADGAFLMTPPIAPPETIEAPLGRQLADAAVEAGVGHIVFSTLENVDKITGGTKYAPHFTDKARVADHIGGLPISHSFVMLAFFYTNLLEYYVPRMEGDTLLLPIYLPEDFRAPFVDPLTATGPVVLEIFSNPERYNGKTLPIVGDIISPREMVETFQRATGLKAEYRNAFTRDGLLRYFPEFAANELLVREILGMVEYAVEYGYFGKEHDLEWSRGVNPDTLNWEQYLRKTGWRGDKQSFGF